ncbi:fungal-specific transcription factor domain-containing protein [Hypoxylon rubiginosum]|uniref:Fungal-specific transcription factor domain-containing protein n=1 Tax=Hypoxylon rubiginosum TaxID=110542 RepID=A0ACB9YIK4_9PEZI|nr:fungal-specific transcription factor domain-containing protein [Hypoxylon rubiginosum]
MDRKLPQIVRQNEENACWTCLKRKLACDGTLPHCKNCSKCRLKCPGFGVRFLWPSGVTRMSKSRMRSPLPPSLSSLALPAEHSLLMQHYLHNFARVALAIDYNTNGYRSLLPMAMHEPVLMNAILAVASSHHSRWQKTTDNTSRQYRRSALQALRQRFNDPELVKSPATLASMLALVTYEVFSGTSKWRGHHEAIRGWVRSRGDCSDLDPFLKAWVCLIDTQCALNTGIEAMPELELWIDDDELLPGRQGSIDALFGCSSRLLKLMWEASQLYAASKNQQGTTDEIRERAEQLQEKIYSTEILPHSDPPIKIFCQQTGEVLSITVDLNKEELQRRMVATAEIFRHACHIYVYRLIHAPEEALSDKMADSLHSALELLTQVPDALGPGANLGWCLVVIGAELDQSHQRDYIRTRWPHLNSLGISNCENARKILEEVWIQRDLFSHGQGSPGRWQHIMQDIGQTQILV